LRDRCDEQWIEVFPVLSDRRGRDREAGRPASAWQLSLEGGSYPDKYQEDEKVNHPTARKTHLTLPDRTGPLIRK
jgi:hypothetical protein